jgi:hypothetical protein
VFDDSVLDLIAEEAQRLTGGRCALRVHGVADPVLGIDLPGESVARGRWLHKRLAEFCGREGVARRYLVVGGTVPTFVSKPPPLPDGWPTDAGDA